MAEEKTPEQIQAEIKKAKAEAKRNEAEAQKLAAEARKAAAEATVAEIVREREEKKRTAERASDEENHVYRFTDKVTSESVRKCITKLTEWHRISPDCDIEIVFFSPGGSIIDGMALFDFIQDLRVSHTVTTGCTGMAASMAGILLQAGDIRWTGEQSWIMIHRAAFGAAGKTFEVEDEVEFVKRIEARILDIFVLRSKLTAAKIKRNWDRRDWWISSEEALKLGLVDEVRGQLPRPSGEPDRSDPVV
jgi:ATP-dependent Clp protease protease subunit